MLLEGKHAVNWGGAGGIGGAATLADVGNVAAFAESDMAKSITGSAINITCGAIVDK